MGAPDQKWRFLYFAEVRDRWIAVERPSLSLIAKVRNWHAKIEVDGLPSDTVLDDDENFVARVPNTRVVVSGIAVIFEQLLIIKDISSLELVRDSANTPK